MYNENMDIKLKIYLIAINIIAIAFFVSNFWANYQSFHINFGHIFFIIIAILTESLAISTENMYISAGYAITFAASLLFGPLPAAIIVSLGTALKVTKEDNEYSHIFNTPLYKVFFNMSNFTISIIVSCRMFEISGGIYNMLDIYNILPILMFTISFLLINSFIMSFLMYFLTQRNFITIYMEIIKMGLLNIAAMTPFGILLVLSFKYDVIAVILIMLPILFARYTFLLSLEVKSKYVQTVQALMHAIEARDKYTEGHSRRVAEIVEMVARELKYREGRIEQLKIASLLHDVGKIGIDNHILNKPSKLTDAEYAKIKEHPEIGYNILKDIKELKDISFIVRHHHERYDGKGYPLGKRPEELNLDVYIVQLADSVDAMATNRPYRSAMDHDYIIDEVLKNRGTQFHPVVVDAYLSAMKKQKKIKEL